MAVNYLAQIEHQNECSAQKPYIFIDLFDHHMAIRILHGGSTCTGFESLVV